MDVFRLDGRGTLITGGTQGVGGAIAVACARAGSRVVVQGLMDDEWAAETLQKCRQAGVSANAVFMDLLPDPATSTASAKAELLYERANALDPHIDTLVNNVGVYLDSRFVDLTDEIFYRTMQLNVAIGMFLTKLFASRWIEHGVRGRVLFTGSINGLLAEQMHVVYDASKGAVAAMVRSLCTELAPQGIRVNSVAPGLVITPLTSVLDRDNRLRKWMELHTPNGQVPKAEVCGPPAVFLLSDAAEHIHGQTLYVDGGMSAWQQPDLPQ